jgi:hypothetical protein
VPNFCGKTSVHNDQVGSSFAFSTQFAHESYWLVLLCFQITSVAMPPGTMFTVNVLIEQQVALLATTF